MPKDYYTTTEAARRLDVSPDTVLKWARAGKIECYRTPGGHARISKRAIASMMPGRAGEASTPAAGTHDPTYQYCWQFYAEGNEAKPECLDCVAYRSRAARCYEMREIPEQFGHLKLHCQDSCEACDYYQLMQGRGTMALILTRNRSLKGALRDEAEDTDLLLRFASSEYECASIIDNFRPDFIVIDCSLGRSRTRELCRNLGRDERIPFTRIFLAAQAPNVKDCAEGEIFGWIRKPFTYEQLKDCLSRPRLLAARIEPGH